ncbi:flavin reductase family protein [Actinomadura hibisca]|uniref:flavin reductase family protein n=1 Tax=Actinomadura hibisca TaxID=68565 RepID=UPI00082D953D|nr:flavin reductase family protein [Actinomadura hibisca]
MTPGQLTAPPARAPAAPEPATADAFRAAMRSCPPPVGIVATVDGGRPAGCAVNAFLALSVNPPSLLVSLQNDSATLGGIGSSGRFGLSLLTERHDRLVRLFSSGPRADRFRAADFEIVHGVPLLAGVPAAFACTVAARLPAHDHTLVVGDVLHAATGPCGLEER